MAGALPAAAVFVPVIIVIALTVPRTRENRFFALGVLLSLPPLFTTVPQDRILLMASFGAFGLLGSFIHTARNAARRGIRGLGIGMLSLHGVMAPLMFIPMLNSNRPFELGSQAIVAALPKHAPPQVVLLNLPVELLPTYAYYIVREQADRTPPQLLQQLLHAIGRRHIAWRQAQNGTAAVREQASGTQAVDDLLRSDARGKTKHDAAATRGLLARTRELEAQLVGSIDDGRR